MKPYLVSFCWHCHCSPDIKLNVVTHLTMMLLVATRCCWMLDVVSRCCHCCRQHGEVETDNTNNIAERCWRREGEWLWVRAGDTLAPRRREGRTTRSRSTHSTHRHCQLTGKVMVTAPSLHRSGVPVSLCNLSISLEYITTLATVGYMQSPEAKVSSGQPCGNLASFMPYAVLWH